MNIFFDDTTCIEEIEVSSQGGIGHDLTIWTNLNLNFDFVKVFLE
jgi:hypothetical protein